ncbi:MAG: Flp pilus assembly protein CpaB [Hyphomicrobiales bacterium]|nr:Flp pilus assembly protein CpaB [Hyphomicrobiales bacterium]
MQMRTIILLVVALAMAGGTAFMAKSWLESNKPVPQVQKTEPVEEEMAEILVATKELATGMFIKPDHLRWQKWPEEGVSDNYIVKGEGSGEESFAGAVVRSRLYVGEPITADRVVHPGEQGFLAAVLEPGKRAISVPVDATRGVAGFVFPGDQVDVLLTIKVSVIAEEEGGQAETRYFSQTLMDAVRVLGVDQDVDNEGGGARVAKTATLEVTPKQAERIAVALELGELSLTLHSIAKEDEDGTTKVAQASKQRRKDSYTRDVDVLDMMGDPMGLPYPNGFGPQATVIRGAEANSVRF